jgi:hypothetical protein
VLFRYEVHNTIHAYHPSFPSSKQNMSSSSLRFCPSYSLLPQPSSFISPFYPNHHPAGPTRHPPHLSPSLPKSPPSHPVLSAAVHGSPTCAPGFSAAGRDGAQGRRRRARPPPNPGSGEPALASSADPFPPVWIPCSRLHGRPEAELRCDGGEDGAGRQGGPSRQAPPHARAPWPTGSQGDLSTTP